VKDSNLRRKLRRIYRWLLPGRHRWHVS